MNTIKIFDNILDQTSFTELYDYVNSNEFPWFYTSTAWNNTDSENLFDYSWSHSIMNNSILYDTPIAKAIFPKILSCLINSKVNFNEILRIRLGLFTPQKEHHVNLPHVDSYMNHNVGLLYLTDCDAATILYKEKYDSACEQYGPLDYYNVVLNKQVTVDNKIESRKNRLLMFDGMQYHSSSIPTNIKKRISINFNFI